jgi:hypothetical protein
METELIKIGTLVELSTMKFGKLKAKDGKIYRAFQSKEGSPIFLGKTLKSLEDEEIKKMSSDLIVGRVDKNLVVFKDAWTWE